MLTAAHARADRNTAMGRYFPAQTSYIEKDNIIDLDKRVIDLENYSEPCAELININPTLKAVAAASKGKFSFGIVVLAESSMINARKKFFDHHIVYCATPDEVMFIDLTKWNGKTQQGQPIFNDLSANYNFTTHNKPGDFGNIIFYIPTKGSMPVAQKRNEIMMSQEIDTNEIDDAMVKSHFSAYTSQQSPLFFNNNNNNQNRNKHIETRSDYNGISNRK